MAHRRGRQDDTVQSVWFSEDESWSREQLAVCCVCLLWRVLQVDILQSNAVYHSTGVCGGSTAVAGRTVQPLCVCPKVNVGVQSS